MPAGRSRKLGRGNRSKQNKRHVRGKFIERHIDQVYEDSLKAEQEVCDGVTGPVGTSSRVLLDEDVPGRGQHYCIPCGKYFISNQALESHRRTKPHKRRLGELAKHQQDGTRPHDAIDAEVAAGRGRPDNGPRLRNGVAATGMVS